jgi:hypothetical protein
VLANDVLRPIAADVGVTLLNSRSETKNTQTFSADMIQTLALRNSCSDT